MQRKRVSGRRPGRDERGAILVMAVPGLVLALVAMALSVDIGRQVVEKRSDQSVADAAALDASRDPAAAQALAERSAARNGFDLTAPGSSLVAQRGKLDANKVFTADPAGPAVLVTVSSHLDYIFQPGDKTLTARAVATMGGGKEAGFRIGTALASVDTTKSALLNGVLGAMIGGSADVVGWQGLASSHVTLAELAEELEPLDAGVQFGTVDQLLAADLTMGELAEAMADALDKKGDSNASLFRGPSGISSKISVASGVQLGKMIHVDQGSGASALDTELNVANLLVGSAMLANGTNTVTVPNIGITIPNVGTTSLSLKVVEGLQEYLGPDQTVKPGPHVTTGQVELILTPTLNVPITVTGLDGATVTGSLPVNVTAAGAEATLTSITCPNPNGGERVTVDLKPVSSSASGPLTVTGSVLGVAVTYNANTTGTAPLLDPAPQFVDFAYPSEFDSAASPAPPKRVGGSPLGLGPNMTFATTATVGTVAAIPPLLDASVNATIATATPLVGPAVSAALPAVLADLDTLVLKPLLDTLGISIGAADVWAVEKQVGGLVTSCSAPMRPILMN